MITWFKSWIIKDPTLKVRKEENKEREEREKKKYFYRDILFMKNDINKKWIKIWILFVMLVELSK